MIISVSYCKNQNSQKFIEKLIKKYGEPDTLPHDGEVIWSSGTKELAKDLMEQIFEDKIILFFSVETASMDQ